MMADWYQKSMDALALNGKAGRTQEAYSRALRICYCGIRFYFSYRGLGQR